MGQIKRETIKFLLPTNLDSIKSNSIKDRRVIPLYINPQVVRVNEQKIIQDNQTIGGFLIQYWGEKLTTINVNGTTGSGGVDAINILYRIYRNEQIEFRKLLLKRADELRNETEKISSVSAGTVDESIYGAFDLLTGGVLSDLTEGISSTMDMYKSLISPDQNSANSNKTINILPTIASFAVSVDMHYQGEVFRGYFNSFNFSENASSPGLFDYDFSFTVLKKTGVRNNFMPWHRNPYDLSGNPKKSDTNRIDQQYGTPLGTTGLTFPSNTVETISKETQTKTLVNENQTGNIIESNKKTLNRFSFISNKK